MAHPTRTARTQRRIPSVRTTWRRPCSTCSASTQARSSPEMAGDRWRSVKANPSWTSSPKSERRRPSHLACSLASSVQLRMSREKASRVARMTEAEFEDFLARCAADAQAKNDALDANYGLFSYARWDDDGDRGTLTFSTPG